MAETGKTFAIGDVHGCVFELRKLINRLPLDAASTIVFLGDYVDRGEHSREVIDTILELARSFRVVPLMGNHERMLLDFVDAPKGKKAGMFIYNGGGATLASYGNEHGQFHVPEAHLRFIRALPLYHAVPGFLFVHAGVPDIPLESLDPARHAPEMLWIRTPFYNSRYPWSRVIVHGHTPVRAPELLPTRINIDTGCVLNGALTAIELPSRRLYTEPRAAEPRRVYLRDQSSRRAAVRFQGAIPVQARHEGGAFEFHTIDYNEFGLYMRGRRTGEAPAWMAGDIIVGTIGDAASETVAFEGEIVRSDTRDDRPGYALKMNSPPMDKETRAFLGK